MLSPAWSVCKGSGGSGQTRLDMWAAVVHLGVGAHLVVRARPGGHLHSVHDLLHVHHLKYGKAVPDGNPHIADDCEVNVLECVHSHTQEHTCDFNQHAIVMLKSTTLWNRILVVSEPDVSKRSERVTDQGSPGPHRREFTV